MTGGSKKGELFREKQEMPILPLTGSLDFH